MPISRGLTAFCTMSVSACMQLPRPMPTMAMNTMTCHSGVSALIVCSRNMPTVTMAVPMIGNSRTRPVRAVNWPAVMEAVIMPATSGSIMRPDFIGEALCTICM